MVVRQGALRAGTGMVLGLVAAYGLAGLLGSVLVGVDPADPSVFMGVAALLGVVALLALYLLTAPPLASIVNLMVYYDARRLDEVFTALSDATRRDMLARLARGPATIGELGEPYPISKPAVTKHVKVLERAGLIRRVKDGRFHHCTLEPGPMRAAEGWIERQRRFWERSLDALARYVETDPSTEGGSR